MNTDDPLAKLDPEIAYSLREIARRMNEYAERRETGIPEIVEKLRVRGFVAEVSTIVTLKRMGSSGSTRLNEQKLLTSGDASEEPSAADLKAANEMGFSLDEVVAVEAKAESTAYDAVLHDLHELAPKLSPKVRNWVCSYISHTYPHLNVRAPGPKHLSDDNIWLAKLANMIARMFTLPYPQKELETLLSHMERLKDQ